MLNLGEDVEVLLLTDDELVTAELDKKGVPEVVHTPLKKPEVKKFTVPTAAKETVKKAGRHRA